MMWGCGVPRFPVDVSLFRRDMSKGKTMEEIDLDAKNSVEFLREAFK